MLKLKLFVLFLFFSSSIIHVLGGFIDKNVGSSNEELSDSDDFDLSFDGETHAPNFTIDPQVTEEVIMIGDEPVETVDNHDVSMLTDEASSDSLSSPSQIITKYDPHPPPRNLIGSNNSKNIRRSPRRILFRISPFERDLDLLPKPSASSNFEDDSIEFVDESTNNNPDEIQFENSVNELRNLISKTTIAVGSRSHSGRVYVGSPGYLSPRIRRLQITTTSSPGSSSDSPIESPDISPSKRIRSRSSSRLSSRSVPNLHSKVAKREKEKKRIEELIIRDSMNVIERNETKQRNGITIVQDVLARLAPVEELLARLPLTESACKFDRFRPESHNISAAAMEKYLKETGGLILPVSMIRTRNNELFAVTDEILGKGLFAVVKTVINVATGAKAVLKIMPLPQDKTLKLREDAFKREVEVLAALNRLIEDFDLVILNRNSKVLRKGYILTNFIEGVHLDQLDWPSLTSNEILLLERNTAEAVDEMFHAGFVHRDPHAGNILVNPDTLNVTLIDFGLTHRENDKMIDLQLKREELKRVLEFRTWKALDNLKRGISFTTLELFERFGDRTSDFDESGIDASSSRASSWDAFSFS